MEGTVQGVIESRLDQDWYAVELSNGHVYVIDQRGADSGVGTQIDPFLMGLFDADGHLIAGTTAPDGGTGIDSRLYYQALRSGRHYLSAAGNGDEATGTGSYTLSIRDLSAADSDATPAGATDWGDLTEATQAQQLSGTIGADDRTDYFGFRLSEPRQVTLELSDLRHNADLTLEDADGRLLARSNAARRANDRISLTLGPGRYYLRVSVAEPGSGGYTLERQAVLLSAAALRAYYLAADADASSDGATALGDITEQAGETAQDGELNGVSDLIDYFSFGLSEARQVQLTLSGQDADADLRLEDAQGAMLASASSSGSADETLTHNLHAGSYYIRVSAQAAGENSYRLAYQTLSLAPDAPPALLAGVEPGLVTLLWIPPQDESIIGYKIMRGDDKDSLSLIGQQENSRSTAYEDRHVTAGKQYSYQVKAYNEFVDGRSSQLLTLTAAEEPLLTSAAQGELTEGVAEAHDVDYAGDATTAGLVPVDGTVRGKISSRDDRDWYAVELTGGRAYRIDLSDITMFGVSVLNPELYGVYDSSNNLLPGSTDMNSGSGLDSRIFVLPPTSGRYYIDVGGSRHGSLGIYRLTVRELVDDYAAGVGTLGQIAIGIAVDGAIMHPGEHDWLRMSLEAGQVYFIQVEGIEGADGALPRPQLKGIYDSMGSQVVSATRGYDATRIRRLWFAAPATDDYFIAVGDFESVQVENFALPVGSYRLTLSEYDDLADNQATTARLELGVAHSGTSDYEGDYDWYAVQLEAGRPYEVKVTGSNYGIRQPDLYDPDGVALSGLVRHDGETGDRAQHTWFVAAQSGTHYVAVGDPYPQGAYQVLIQRSYDRGASADYPADQSTLAHVTVGGSLLGKLNSAGDQDWFSVRLEAGKAYRVDVAGERVSSDNGVSNPYLIGVYRPNLNLLPRTTNDDWSSWPGSTYDSRAYLWAPVSGTYFVAVRGAHPYSQGVYRVTVTEFPAQDDDYAENRRTTGRLNVNGEVTGIVDMPEDRDWFRVELQRGTQYRFDMFGTLGPHSWYTERRAVMYGIYDSGGRLLLELPGREAYFTPGSSALESWQTGVGTYYVSVGGPFPLERHLFGNYWLMVNRVRDDYRSNTSTEAVVEVGGSISGSIELPRDHDWIRVDLVQDSTYRITLRRTHAGPRIAGMFDARGRSIESTTTPEFRYQTPREYTAQASGAHYIDVTSGWSLSGYTVSVEIVTP